MFVKLRNKIDVDSFIQKETQSKFGMETPDGFIGIHYRFAEGKDFEKITSLIPPDARPHFCISVMNINTKVPPHTDSGIKTAINVYYRTSGNRTQFYSFRDDSRPLGSKVPGQTDGSVYTEFDLIAEGGFAAQPGDVWVLDVSKPHAVLPIGDAPIDRVAITYATDKFTFNEVCELLRTTRSL
jgi:hypothetical protein